MTEWLAALEHVDPRRESLPLLRRPAIQYPAHKAVSPKIRAKHQDPDREAALRKRCPTPPASTSSPPPNSRRSGTTSCIGCATIRSRPASPRRSSSRAKTCAVFIDEHTFGDLQSFREIPTQVLYRCEWGHDDDSLKVQNLPTAPQQQPKVDMRGKMDLI